MTGAEVVPAEEPDVGAIERQGTRIEYTPPASLFRTDEPALIVARATEVAEVLSTVLRERKLTKRIGPKDHVLVEGWTLCGSMLGVFPIVVWTHKLEDGWEARVEARTRDGATVGAAEAMCLRAESRWASADEYAIRSMAQTRATSKAMRGPLGFVVQLAGFDPTPEEEIPAPNIAKSQPEPDSPDFNPGVHLAPGAISGKGFLEQLGEAFKAIDPAVDWKAVLNQLAGDAPRDEAFWRRVSNAVYKLGDLTVFPPPDDDEIVAAFAWAFEGTVVELDRPIEAEHEELNEEAADAAERDDPAPLSGDEVDAALAADGDDIPFGKEEADAT